MSTVPPLLGKSPRMEEIARTIPKLARTRVPVLLLGESGTGKDIVARAIHEANPIGDFVLIDCTALAGTLFESELFGHVKGAFTGAIAAKPGLIEMADGGTAFFDEIGDVPLDLQVKLLRLLQRKEYRAVGSVNLRRADFRIIAATNRELADRVERGLFRRDLYYRLKVVTIRVPPLRERKEDIDLLVKHFLAALGPGYRLGSGVLEKLLAYDWPGNVRELEHTLAAMAAMSSDAVLDLGALPPELRILPPASRLPSQERPSLEAERTTILPLAQVEKQYIVRALELTNWDCAEAARMLRIGRTTLYRKIKEYGLQRFKAYSASSSSR